MGKVVTRAAIPTVVCTALCVATWYLIGPSGHISAIISVDLSFPAIPIGVLYALLLASWLARVLITGFVGKLLSGALLGAALAFVAYQLSAEAPRVTEPSWVAHLSDIRHWTALGIAGVTVYWLAPQLGEDERTRRAQPAVGALGLFLIALALWRMSVPSIQFFDHSEDIGLIILSGLALNAVSLIASYGQRARSPYIAHACRWATTSQLRNFLAGAAISSYFLLARPEIVAHFEYAPLIEWGVVCLVAWRLFRGVRFRLEDQHAYALEFSAWEKHAQLLERKVDRRFTYLAETQEKFVELGDRSRLLIRLVLLLDSNRWSKERIYNALDPLITHHESSLPWFAFGWEQRRVKERARRARKKVLDHIMSSIAQESDESIDTTEVEA